MTAVKIAPKATPKSGFLKAVRIFWKPSGIIASRMSLKLKCNLRIDNKRSQHGILHMG